MNSKLFRVDVVDVLRSVLIAVVVAVITVLYGIATAAEFDLFSADWSAIGQQMLNNGFIAAVIVLFDRFVSDEQGRMGGVL